MKRHARCSEAALSTYHGLGDMLPACPTLEHVCRGPQPLPLPPQFAASRQGSAALALRPVSARTYMRSYEEPAPAGELNYKAALLLQSGFLVTQQSMSYDAPGCVQCFSQPRAGPMPLQTFKSYKNDLFGDEDGDVLAAETIPAAKPIEVAVPRPTTPSNRVQQQIALNQQKRLARLQVTDAPIYLLSIPGKQVSSCCIYISYHSFDRRCGANQCVARLLKQHHHITTATAQHDPQCVNTDWLCTVESGYQTSL